MNLGLNPDEYEQLSRIVVAPLKASGARVWCFGSRARGDHKKFSDVDIMIESLDDLTATIGAVKEAIVESSFPYKVDIVDLRWFAKEYLPGFLTERILL